MIIRIFVASVLAKPLNNAQIVRGVFVFMGIRQQEITLVELVVYSEYSFPPMLNMRASPCPGSGS